MRLLEPPEIPALGAPFYFQEPPSTTLSPLLAPSAGAVHIIAVP